jgi:hypothetical protein
MDNFDNRIFVTKPELQALVLAAAKTHPDNDAMDLSDVIILDKGNGVWGAAFSRSGPNAAEHALAAVPAVQSKYRLKS